VVTLCLVAVLTAAAARGAGNAPGRSAVNGVTFRDVTGDSLLAPDIDSIRVENDDAGLLIIQVRLVPRVPAATDFIAVFIDSDRAAATEREWAMAATGLGTTLLCRTAPAIDCAVPQGSFRAAYTGEAATFSINRADIGVDDGFDFWVGTSAPRPDDPSMSDNDFAPAEGQFSYEVVISPPCIVPNVRGRTLASARSALGRANCTVGRIARRASTTVPKGRLISTTPRAGARLANRGRVNLVVSSGRAR